MPNENQTDPRKGFVPRYLPWLLGGLMLIIYWETLNHWVTLLNIRQVASVCGWTWQPQVLNPLILLVTLPFRWLPMVHVPVAMDVFAAFCAAATLAVLARSVAILPHDRTNLERGRERSDFSFLTGWVAWVPPVAAVVFIGFQLGFWENATSFSGDMFDLFWFAVILWQLLEYRLDENENRLFLAAVLCGAGLVENWAMIGFFPLFILMLIWLRGFSFFHAGFLARIILSGLAGLLLLLVVLAPLAGKYSGIFAVGAWEAIKYHLNTDWRVVRQLGSADIRHCLALISLTSLLPALVMSFRWSANFGDSSRLGTNLVNYSMHLVNMIFLGMLVWMTFDPPFSPARSISDLGMHSTALTIYYIIALCIGYYSGYFLLIFGKDPVRTRRTTQPEPALPKSLLWLSPVVVAGALASLTILAGLLIYKNTPALLAANDESLRKFGEFGTKLLPPDGAILLCDSDDSVHDIPLRAFAVQAQLARDGRLQAYPVVDTSSLQSSPYHHYLHQRFPKVWPDLSATNGSARVDPLRLLSLLDRLSKSNNLCYLDPSFGYFFERFYQEPHGMVYSMKVLPAETLLPPALSTNLIAENEAYWKEVMADSGPSIQRAVHPLDLAKQPGILGWLMAHLHVSPDSNPNALTVGTYYSKSLNALGVQVQREGGLDQAAALFTDAQELNSNNVAATVNLAFNKLLHSGSTTTVDLSRATADQFGKYRGWNEVLNANGPFDETSFCYGLGCWMLQNRHYCQAAPLFNRVRQLSPDNLATRMLLAQIYILYRLPDPALQALHDPLTHPFRFGLNDTNSTEFNELVAAADFQKGRIADGVALLKTEMDRHPDDETLLLSSAKTFNVLHLHTNALETINRKLSHTPNDPNWLLDKGLISLQAGAYDEAVASLSKLLEVQTNQPNALFARGMAYLQNSRLDAARTDFLQLQLAYTNSFQVAYDLGEIAWRQHQTNEAIRNYRIYLANAPTNAPEQKTVRGRVTEMDGK
ncbi:MAG: tetratricopeptide repeat protein [Verrucomicrobiota bacterium]